MDDIRDRLAEITGPEPADAERALLVRLLTSYTTKTPPGLDRLAVAVAAQDVEAVRDQAHALKGSAANVGVSTVSHLCGTLEDAARAGAVDGGKAMVDDIRAAYAQAAPVCVALAAELTAQ
ncbi:Hpt domain-containing protein [Actinoplanes sp. NPDC051859]|uniref:Hpt domain-containing protein n=1 Tax=Actinoplanes sp. NPDC051859 TaxID=3363909 RepID=UPI0037880F8E